jgi:hypothetical protein
VLLAESFLHANPWVPGVVVAVVLFLLGWVITLILRKRDRESKTFDFRPIADLPILSNRPDDDDLKVTYMDEEVHNPRIVRVRLTNTGKQVIKATDFLDPYFIRLNGSKLLDTIITDESASDLLTFIADAREGWVQLNIRTLNPGDTFTVQMIVDSENSTDISISGRVEGQTRPSRIVPTKAELNDARDNAIVGTLGLVLLGLPGLVVALGPDNVAVNIVGWIMFGLGFVWLVLAWRSAISKRRWLANRLQATPLTENWAI